MVLVFWTVSVTIGYGQVPPGYYDPVAGLYGDTLRLELSKIIDGHTVQSYSSLWSHFWNTDRKPDSTVWDMYSDNPGGTPPYSYTFFTDQCGNYSGEGDCYNREHSFPKSWFNDQSPMNTDIFHLFPTDGYVNGQRGNLPYGETNNASWTSQNGSKRGPSSVPGYSGNVFEPLDEYKGDFARAYFYMLTRYYSLISGWTSDMLSGDDFSPWAEEMLLDWHRTDTISQKERDRNEAVFLIQQNRNPYVDYADFVELVWGDSIIEDSMPNHLFNFEVNEIMIQYQNGELRITNNELQESLEVWVFDAYGREEAHIRNWVGESLGLKLSQGLHFIHVQSRNQAIRKKFWAKE